LLFPDPADGITNDGPKRPTRRLSLTTRHVIFSGSFLDSGVKKFATASSIGG
jgi:hypothetical protein